MHTIFQITNYDYIGDHPTQLPHVQQNTVQKTLWNLPFINTESVKAWNIALWPSFTPSKIVDPPKKQPQKPATPNKEKQQQKPAKFIHPRLSSQRFLAVWIDPHHGDF